MKIAAYELKIIVLWTIAAYLLGSLIVYVFFFIVNHGYVRNEINNTTVVLLLTLLAIVGLAYGFCAFKAVEKLKGKTKLSTLKITLYMCGAVLILDVCLKLLYSLLFGYPFTGSSNLAGYAGFLIGGYLYDKKVKSKR